MLFNHFEYVSDALSFAPANCVNIIVVADDLKHCPGTSRMVVSELSIHPNFDESLRCDAYQLIIDLHCSESLEYLVKASERFHEDVQGLLET